MRDFSIFWIILPFIFCACQSEKEISMEQRTKISATQNPFFDYRSFELLSGDLLFQDSDCGPFCDAIEKVTFGVGGSDLSHVGLVFKNKKNELAVLEAISAGVVETPLDTFFNRSFDKNGNSKIIVGRLKSDYQKLIPGAIDFAKRKLGKPYDDVFDILNDKYYCSELLYESFKFANNDQPIFNLRKMTFNDPDTKEIFPIWKTYFEDLKIEVPEGAPGLNPGSMSRSMYLDIIHWYFENKDGRIDE